MELTTWNEALVRYYFRHPQQRVYLRVDNAELGVLSNELQLGLQSPAEDLLDAARAAARQDPALKWIRNEGDKWRAARKADADVSPSTPPPWLCVVAVSVLVASRATEQGSIAFYLPFSQALQLSDRLTMGDYETSLFKWWNDLDWWLTTVHKGSMGLPSWKRIPKSPPRNVIGHIYTQILLRREELRDIEAFLDSLGDLQPGEIEITGATAAATDLLARLWQWATQRKVSSRLADILAGGGHEGFTNSKESLKFMLLDRLLSKVEESDAPRAHTMEHEARLIVTLDDFQDRRLRFSVVAPSAASLWKSPILTFDGECIGPLEAGRLYRTQIPVDGSALRDGLSIPAGDDATIVYRPLRVVALAVRDRSMWCSVDDAEPGEAVYLLVPDDAAQGQPLLVEGLRRAAIDDVPAGWKLYGPQPLPDGEELRRLGLPVRRSWRAVPRLSGGLEIARRTYLVSGPPEVLMPGGDEHSELNVDGKSVDVSGLWSEAVGGSVRLHELKLSAGDHHADIGPYRLSFKLAEIDRVPAVVEDFGRSRFGTIAPVTMPSSDPLFIGAARRPRDPTEFGSVILAPIGHRMVVLGSAGHAAECSASMESWAIEEKLHQHAFEPTQRSSYVTRAFPFLPISWLAVQTTEGGTWTVFQVPEAGDLSSDEDETQQALGREVVSEIGLAPRVVAFDASDVDPGALRARWIAYARKVMESLP